MVEPVVAVVTVVAVLAGRGTASKDKGVAPKAVAMVLVGTGVTPAVVAPLAMAGDGVTVLVATGVAPAAAEPLTTEA